MIAWIVIAFAVWLVLGNIALAWWCRDDLRGLWKEPVLRHPVVIIESDDWGPGPPEHAQRLDSLADILARHRDRTGHPAVMAVGLVLAVADGAAMAEAADGSYRRRRLDAPEFEPLRQALEAGRQRGVFTLQLHGMEHYWPPALLRAAEDQPRVREWLLARDIQPTEALPDALQSRWIDSSTLPSRSLSAADMSAAARDEATAFDQIFGVRPAVVVPPTFVWNLVVERAWVQEGARAIVTPGVRYESRDEQGRLSGAGDPLRNGSAAVDGAVYLVRDVYFEPARGHTVEGCLRSVAARIRTGRPAMIETHRFNFTDSEQSARRSCDALDALLQAVVARWPSVRFLTTEALADGLRHGDPGLVRTRPMTRFAVWLRRLPDARRYWRFARLTGARVIAVGLQRWLNTAAGVLVEGRPV